jgi:lysophospholipase L1-like esterase
MFTDGAMRRFFYWYLPIGAAIAAAFTFGSGFYSFLRGDTGKPVEFVSQQRPAASASARTQIVPIILGDSLARGAGDQSGLGIGGNLDRELRQRNIKASRTVNLGINGARTADLLRQMESANIRRLIGEANVVIVSIGGNDLWGGSDWRNAAPADPEAVMDDVLDRIASVLDVVRKANPSARVFLIGLYNPFRDAPMGAQVTTYVSQWNARLMQRFSSDPNVTVVQTSDIFSHRDRLALDRFHPGDEGYQLIARRLADAM